MRKLIALACAGLMLCFVTTLVYAQAKAEPPKEHHITGVVKETIPCNVEAKKPAEVLVVTKLEKNGKEVEETLTFTLNAESKIMIGDKPGHCKDIEKGEHVKVTYLHKGDVREVIELQVIKGEKTPPAPPSGAAPMK